MSIFEDEFRSFALDEARAQVPSDPILFCGSSSIRLWKTLTRDFAGVSVVNRGFGGSTLRECVAEIERLVFPVAPRAIVLYAGDNDLNQGAQPEEVRALFEEFVSQVDDRLGLVPIVFISIKASASRLWNIANIRRANALIRDTVTSWPQARFLDVYSPMMQDDGQNPRRELYSDDDLHLSAAGYRLWTTQVRASLSELGLFP